MKIRKILSIFFIIIAIVCNTCIPTQASIEHNNKFWANEIHTNFTTITPPKKLVDDITYSNASNQGSGRADLSGCYKSNLIKQYSFTNDASSSRSFFDNVFWIGKMGLKAASPCIEKSPQFLGFVAPFLICGGVIGICKYLLDKIYLGCLRSRILKYAEKSSKMEACKELAPVSLAKELVATGIRDDTNIMVCRLVYKLLFRRSLSEKTVWTIISKRPFDTIPNLVDYLEKLSSYTEVFDEYKLDTDDCKLSNFSTQRLNFRNLISDAKNSTEILNIHLEIARLIYFLEEFQGKFAAKTRINSYHEFLSYSQSLRKLLRAMYEIREAVSHDTAELLTDLSIKIPEIVEDSAGVIGLISGVTTILEMVTDAGLSPHIALGFLTKLMDNPMGNLFDLKRATK